MLILAPSYDDGDLMLSSSIRTYDDRTSERPSKQRKIERSRGRALEQPREQWSDRAAE